MTLNCHTLATAAFLLLGASAVSAQTMDECEKLKIDNAKLKFENANLKKGIIAHSSATVPVQTAGPARASAASPTQGTQQQSAYKVDYKLVKCQGDAKMQTVTITFLLTNSGPNTDRRFPSLKAVDESGEEYSSFKTQIGSGAIQTARLATGVPIKAVGIIPKILPTTKKFKLVTFAAWGGEHPGGTIPIEFRDVAITWK